MSISEAIVDSISGNIEELRKENIELSKQLKDVREEYEELFLSHDSLGKILENRDKEKAEAIMGLVELMVGAFVSGFVDKNNPTISEIYQVARNHVKDNYGTELTKKLVARKDGATGYVHQNNSFKVLNRRKGG